MNELLKLEEAAKLLPFWTIGTIRNYTARGMIPCLRVGRRVFFEEKELRTFASSIVKKQPGTYGRNGTY